MCFASFGEFLKLKLGGECKVDLSDLQSWCVRMYLTVSIGRRDRFYYGSEYVCAMKDM